MITLFASYENFLKIITCCETRFRPSDFMRQQGSGIFLLRQLMDDVLLKFL